MASNKTARFFVLIGMMVVAINQYVQLIKTDFDIYVLAGTAIIAFSLGWYADKMVDLK